MGFTDKEAGVPRRPSWPGSKLQYLFALLCHGAFAPGLPFCPHSCHSQFPFTLVLDPLLTASPGLSDHGGPLRSVLHVTGCVKPGEGPLYSATDEGTAAWEWKCQGGSQQSFIQPIPPLSFPLPGLSSLSWFSELWGTINSAKIKKRSKGNFEEAERMGKT